MTMIVKNHAVRQIMALNDLASTTTKKELSKYFHSLTMV
jgi:hypothetical protein